MRLAPNDCWLNQAESRHFRLVYLSLCLNILSLISRGLTYLDLLVDRTVIIYIYISRSMVVFTTHESFF